MNALKKTKQLMMLLSLLLLVLLLSGCASPKVVPKLTQICPKPEPMSGQLLLITRPNSTSLSKRADTWYVNSGKLLDSVTVK